MIDIEKRRERDREKYHARRKREKEKLKKDNEYMNRIRKEIDGDEENDG